MVQSDRRTVLKHTGASLATLATLSLAPAKAAGANEKIVMGAIGCGGQGTGPYGTFEQTANTRLIFIARMRNKTHTLELCVNIEFLTAQAYPTLHP
jgi:hypothetical protein